MGGTVCCFESVEEESASLLQRDSVRMKRLVRNNELTPDEQFNESFDKVKKELEANINMVEESITETKKELKHIEEAMLSVLGGREADTLPAADAIDLQLLLSREDECNTSLAQYAAQLSTLQSCLAQMKRSYISAAASPLKEDSGTSKNFHEFIQVARKMAPRQAELAKTFADAMNADREKDAEELAELDEKRADGGEVSERMMRSYALNPQQLDRLNKLKVPKHEPVIRLTTTFPTLPVKQPQHQPAKRSVIPVI